jgi:hypothetical protein
MTDPRIGRRALLVAALGSVTAACTRAGGEDVPAVMEPLPAAPAETGGTTAIKPVAYWTSVFQQSWGYLLNNSARMSKSADSWDHYNVSYSVDAFVAMFRATGERRYLNEAFAFVENVVDSAVPSTSLPGGGFHDSYRGWASSQNGEHGDEIPLFESYFWRYGTALLTAVRERPEIYADKNYRMRYERLLAFAETNVFAKWWTRGAREYIYRERTHMASHWALISLNLSRVTADPGRRQRYLEVAATIDVRLHKQMRRNPVEPTAYFWSDVWGSAKRPGQDVSHGNGVLAYVVDARDHGTAWTATDTTAFSSLLTKVIWPKGTTYREYVDGTGTDNGWWSDGFVKLGRYNAAVQARLESHRVVNEQFAANMALNARLLRP